MVRAYRWRYPTPCRRSFPFPFPLTPPCAGMGTGTPRRTQWTARNVRKPSWAARPDRHRRAVTAAALEGASAARGRRDPWLPSRLVGVGGTPTCRSSVVIPCHAGRRTARRSRALCQAGSCVPMQTEPSPRRVISPSCCSVASRAPRVALRMPSAWRSSCRLHGPDDDRRCVRIRAR